MVQGLDQEWYLSGVDITREGKHNAVCYQRVREAQAGEPAWVRVAHISGTKKLSELFIKIIVGKKRQHWFRWFQW